MKWKSGFRNPGKFCSWNLDYSSRNPEPTNDWNSRIQVLLTKTGIQFLGSRIQDCPGILYTGRYLRHIFGFQVTSANTRTSKSQGLLRFYLQLAKDLLKINFFASFRRDSVFRFENIALSNFQSLLRVTLIRRPKRPSHMLKNNFIA